MPIVIRGKTICRGCGRPIQDGEAIVGFAPFVSNSSDPLHQFNDAAFHERCFEQHPLAERAAAEYAAIRSAAEERACALCGLPIASPDELFAAGLLSSDSASTLAVYNGLQAHRQCLNDWEGLPKLLDELESSAATGTLTGTAAEQLISALQTILAQSAVR